MKLQLENHNYKYTVETEYNDVDLDEYLKLFKGLLIQATFNEQQFKRGILELADELKELADE
jgi:hypothetical protein